MFPPPSQGVEEKSLPKQYSVSENLEEAVGRVLASPAFLRSHRLSQLLRYLAEHTTNGDLEGLKESIIGQRIFGRPADYSAAEDNIVRANIRQLRLKIDEYYTGPGAADPWRVTLPKGSYALIAERSVAGKIPDATRRPPRKPIRVIPVLVTVAAICGAAVLLFVAFASRPFPVSPVTVRASSSHCLLGLLSPNPGQRMLVVVPDSDVQLYQRLTGHTVSLQDYLARKFTRPEAFQGTSRLLAAETEALFHHVTTQSFVLELIPKFAQVIPPGQLSVRHPSTLAVNDFEKDNALLISGPYGDPWVQLFDPNLSFQIAMDSDKRAHIADRTPHGGPQTYYNYTDSSHTVICYARIAYIPGLSSSNRVLLAGGPHTASTDAACRFLTSPASLDSVCRLFHVTSPSQLPWFELLVEARALGNSPWSIRVLAHRVVAGNAAQQR